MKYQFQPFADKMKAENLADISSLTSGEQEKMGQRYLHKTVVIKLNGGLGTGMGMIGPGCFHEQFFNIQGHTQGI